MTVRSIMSGGQTGADRGALEAAHDLGLSRGGWAPEGWRAEDGQIPLWYRAGMMQSPSSSYRVRTRANVEASHGTLIVSLGELAVDSGSYLTAALARTVGKPCIHMTIDKLANPTGAAIVREWLEGKSIRTLNVAGPRESREPGIQAATRGALVALLCSVDMAKIFDHIEGPEDDGLARAARGMRGNQAWTSPASWTKPEDVQGEIDPDGFGWDPPA